MLTPFAYQIRAADTIVLSSKAVYNIFEPGLGKSCVALQVARAKRARRVMIVCPVSAIYAWKLEIQKFWPEHPPVTILNTVGDAQALARDGVFIVTYGLLSRSESLVDWVRQATPMDLSILDEAHALKNAAANRTRAVRAEPCRGTLADPARPSPRPDRQRRGPADEAERVRGTLLRGQADPGRRRPDAAGDRRVEERRGVARPLERILPARNQSQRFKRSSAARLR